MLKNPIYPDSLILTNCNNGNLHEYDPYMIINNELIIDEDWWNTLTRYNLYLIEKNLSGKYKLGKVITPHEIQNDNNDKLLEKIHLTYIDSFDYNVWYQSFSINNTESTIPKNVSMIHIEPDIKNILLKIYRKEEVDPKKLDTFKLQIDKNLEKGCSYFVRLSCTSGKNEKVLEPLHTRDEIIRRITTNKLFAEKEYMRDKPTYLIIIPWNDNIDSRYEFRIFVVNGKITCACRQLWYEYYQYSSFELDNIIKALSNIEFLNIINYKSFVADVYIDINSSTCYLIEINPFGAHCGAGSALFNWISDYDILYGINNDMPEFRYLSALKYI